MCRSTVRTLNTSSSAIAWLLRPCATSRRTSSSRLLKPFDNSSWRDGTGAGEDAAGHQDAETAVGGDLGEGERTEAGRDHQSAEPAGNRRGRHDATPVAEFVRPGERGDQHIARLGLGECPMQPEVVSRRPLDRAR